MYGDEPWCNDKYVGYLCDPMKAGHDKGCRYYEKLKSPVCSTDRRTVRDTPTTGVGDAGHQVDDTLKVPTTSPTHFEVDGAKGTGYLYLGGKWYHVTPRMEG